MKSYITIAASALLIGVQG